MHIYIYIYIHITRTGVSLVRKLTILLCVCKTGKIYIFHARHTFPFGVYIFFKRKVFKFYIL